MRRPASPIHIWNRSRRVVEVEKVLGGKWIEFGYQKALIRKFVNSWLIQRFLSHFVGWFQKSVFSKASIERFVKDYEIDMSPYEKPLHEFENFNDFFIRRFKTQAVNFPQDLKILGSPCEARLSVFSITSNDVQMTLKDTKINFSKLWPHQILPQNPMDFIGGHVWVFRLCPVDYHRFHFCDAGLPGQPHRVSGKLGSVNPTALNIFPSTFVENERQATFFESQNFGKMVFVEVGALCVGKIKQTFKSQSSVVRGQEKGFFEFGASTVLMVTHSKSVEPDPDLIEKTNSGFESRIGLGEAIGKTKT